MLEDVVRDLRSADAVVDHLESADAITQGYPESDDRRPAEVIVVPVYDGSDAHRGAVTKTYRVQVTVTSTKAWRDARANEAGTTATTAMLEILDAVGSRLDDAHGTEEAPLGGESGISPPPEPGDGGRIAITDDWRLRGTYETE